MAGAEQFAWPVWPAWPDTLVMLTIRPPRTLSIGRVTALVM